MNSSALTTGTRTSRSSWSRLLESAIRLRESESRSSSRISAATERILFLSMTTIKSRAVDLLVHAEPEKSYAHSAGRSNQNPLDLVEGDGIAGAVVELGGARRLVRGDRLGVLNGAPVLEVGGDAGRPEPMAADARRQVRPPPPPLDHADDVVAVPRPLGELARAVTVRN